MAAELFARSSDASASTVGDRVVLYHRVSRSALVLNPTGSWIWDQLETPRSVAALTESLRGRFPALSSEDAGRDVQAFLADLTRHDMILVRP
jgi:hypothetical protein